MSLPQPVFSSTSILPEEYAFIQQFCRTKGIRHVIEYGPGVSTLAFLSAGCDVVSIEENRKCFETMQRTLTGAKCALVFGFPPEIMNHPAILNCSFDLAFVDGPAAKGALPRLKSVQSAMSRSPVVMLHDAHRPGERATIAEVTKSGGWTVEWHPSKRGIAILRKTKKSLRVRFVCNTHTIGGGEISSSYLMTLMASHGHKVILSPCSAMSDRFPLPRNVEVLPPYTEHPALPCDVLVFYANDHAYKLEQNQKAWLQAIKGAGRTVAVLNFVAGQAVNEWFASRLAKAIFLNTTKEAEFLPRAKGFKGQSVVLPPPVDLAPFLAIRPDYSTISFVRHSRIYGKYDPKETVHLIGKFESLVSGAHFWFMAAPEFLRPLAKANPHIHMLAWNQEPVPQFLSHGSIFWYRLPKSLKDQGPRVIVEAMAAGIPCIADNRDGARDRITPETGWLCDSADDYVAAIRQIVRDPTLLLRKGQAARQRAVDHFRPERWIDEILSVS